MSDFENEFTGFGGDSFGKDFGGESFGEQASDFSGGGSVTTTGEFNGIPLSQINGLQNAKYNTVEAAEEAIRAQDKDEILRRKANSEAFKWIKTIVDKEDWVTSPSGTQTLKSPKFLGWLVVRADTNGSEVPMTHDQLLAYIPANCSKDGKIGSGDTGLRLTYSVRENKGKKAGNFTNSIVLSLKPLQPGLSKYAPGRVEAAKEIQLNADGTPKQILKPGRKTNSNNPDDYTDAYDYKPQYKDIFKKRKSSKETKNDEKSTKAFSLAYQIYGDTSELF